MVGSQATGGCGRNGIEFIIVVAYRVKEGRKADDEPNNKAYNRKTHLKEWKLPQ